MKLALKAVNLGLHPWIDVLIVTSCKSLTRNKDGYVSVL